MAKYNSAKNTRGPGAILCAELVPVKIGGVKGGAFNMGKEIPLKKE
jgi:hypothetical protein